MRMLPREEKRIRFRDALIIAAVTLLVALWSIFGWIGLFYVIGGK